MIVVIIAGGSGTRLWPLSTSERPKHLLAIDGDEQSLLQHTYARARALTDKIYIASEAGHIQHVKQQLADLPDTAFIVEPGRRGTANCIVAALVRIAEGNNEAEPIVFMVADHFIRDTEGFVHSFRLAAESAEKYGRITLIGIEPDAPATGFGYIEKGQLADEDIFAFDVNGFKEKPDHETAQRYLASGKYLWNSGYFVGSVAAFKQAMAAYAPTLHRAFEQLSQLDDEAAFNDAYLALESISIDYALIEKVPDLLVLPASFDWMDLGSFKDLHKAVDNDESGNHIRGRVDADMVQNSYIQNHEDKPVAVIGLDNVVVVNTPHGLLVARKDLSQRVGEASKRLLDSN